MKCTTCGAELRDGSKFCPSCGAPAPETDAAAETPDPATPRPARGPRKRRVPTPLVVALAALGIATAASAGYLVYALVIDPLPPAAEQPAEKADEAEKDKAADQDAKQDGATETDAEADDTAATEPEETPAQEPTPTEEAPSAAPAATHDFECDASEAPSCGPLAPAPTRRGTRSTGSWTTISPHMATSSRRCASTILPSRSASSASWSSSATTRTSSGTAWSCSAPRSRAFTSSSDGQAQRPVGRTGRSSSALGRASSARGSQPSANGPAAGTGALASSRHACTAAGAYSATITT